MSLFHSTLHPFPITEPFTKALHVKDAPAATVIITTLPYFICFFSVQFPINSINHDTKTDRFLGTHCVPNTTQTILKCHRLSEHLFMVTMFLITDSSGMIMRSESSQSSSITISIFICPSLVSESDSGGAAFGTW